MPTDPQPLPGGIGASLPRREDDRFIRGQGTFVADVSLPGMAHMAVLRSPMARAKIRSINVAPAFALPGVIVVVTGELLASRNLAWYTTPIAVPSMPATNMSSGWRHAARI